MMLFFRCVPTSARLTAESCARQHKARRRSSNTKKLNAYTQQQALNPTCAACSMGAAHARGERPETWGPRPRGVVGTWIEGAPVEREIPPASVPAELVEPVRPRVVLPVVAGPLTTKAERAGASSSVSRRKRATKPKSTPKPRPVRRYAYHGQELTTKELAALAGICRESMSARLRKAGGDAARAMVVRRGPARASSRLYEHEGQQRTCAELAALAGCTIPAMWRRLNERRMDAAAAVALGAHQPEQRSDARRWPFKGDMLTASDLAALAGCSLGAMRERLRTLRPGETAEDAVALGAWARSSGGCVRVQVSVPTAVHDELAARAAERAETMASVAVRLVAREGPAPRPPTRGGGWAPFAIRVPRALHATLLARARRDQITVPVLVRRMVEHALDHGREATAS